MKKVMLAVCLGLLAINIQAQNKETVSIKILTFNILHGATTQNTFDLDAIAKVIIDAQPDFVALQEVDFRTNRAHQYDLTSELAYRSKLIPLFGRAMYYDGGEYGEGILSKHSIVASTNIPLPYQEGDEPRTALSVTSVLPSGDTIAFIATHLDHKTDGTSRQLQTNMLAKIGKQCTYPAILAGDLNALPHSKAISILEKEWTPSYNRANPQPTYPSHHPTQKIDYILMKPSHMWKVINRNVIADTIASDHCAYLVTLELQKQ